MGHASLSLSVLVYFVLSPEHRNPTKGLTSELQREYNIIGWLIMHLYVCEISISIALGKKFHCTFAHLCSIRVVYDTYIREIVFSLSLATPRDTWPKMDKPGLSMRMAQSKDG